MRKVLLLLSAMLCAVISMWAERPFVLVTDISQLADGDSIIIVALNEDYGMSADAYVATSVFREAKDVTKVGDKIEYFWGAGTLELVFLAKRDDGLWNLRNRSLTANRYHFYASSSTSDCLSAAPLDKCGDDGNAKITIAPSGKAVIAFQGENTHNTIRFVPKGKKFRFTCCLPDDVDGTGDIAIYKLFPEGAAPVTPTDPDPGTGEGGDETKPTDPDPGTGEGGGETKPTDPDPGTGEGGGETKPTDPDPGTGDGGSETKPTDPDPGTGEGGSETKPTDPDPSTGEGGSETKPTDPDPGTGEGGGETKPTDPDPGTGEGGSETKPTDPDPGTGEGGGETKPTDPDPGTSEGGGETKPSNPNKPDDGVMPDDMVALMDVLNENTIGMAGTGIEFRQLSDVNVGSSSNYVVYCGHSKDCIELRSNKDNYGIVMTATNGNVAKVIIDWNEVTMKLREVEVYGRNTPYDSPADLYDDATSGDLLGILYHDEAVDETSSLTIAGDYAYIGLKSALSQLFLNNVKIIWYVPAEDEGELPTPPHFLTPGGLVQKGTKVEIVSPIEDGEIYYTLDGTQPTTESTRYTGPIEIKSDMTITAAIIIGKRSSEAVSETYQVAEVVTNINSVSGMADGTLILVNRRLTVVYSYGEYNYVYDGLHYSLLYKNGLGLGRADIIEPVWDGRVVKDDYGSVMIVPESELYVRSKAKELPTPENVDFESFEQVLTASHQHLWVTVMRVEFGNGIAGAGISTGSQIKEDGTTDSAHEIRLDNIFGMQSKEKGIYDVTGFIGLRQGEIVIYATGLAVSASGTYDVESDRTGGVEYFDLRGARVSNPLPGKIYIIRKDGKSRKVMFK